MTGILKKIMLTPLCCLCICSLYAQENKHKPQEANGSGWQNSKAGIIDSVAFSLSDSDPDSALRLATTVLDAAMSADNAYNTANALSIIGWAYFKLGDIDSSLRYMAAAKDMFHSQGRTTKESDMLMKLSSVYESISDYPNALKNLKESMQLANLNKDAVTVMLAEKMIGNIYVEQGYNDKARQHLETALKMASGQNNPRFYGDALSSLATLQVAMGNFDSAKICLRLAHDLYAAVNCLSSMAIVSEDMGVCFGDNTRQALDSALFYYQRAYEINIRINNRHDAAYEKMLIGEVLTRKKQYIPAEKNITESFRVFDSLHNTREEYQCLKDLSVLYDSMHDYKRAYATLTRSYLFYDTLNKLEKSRTIADMLAKYEANKKDNTIALLNTRSELAERKLSRTRIIEAFSLVLIVLSAILTLVLLNRNNIKQRLKQLQMRNQIASDLHDEVGSSLSSILMLGKIALVEKNGRDEIINKINSNAEEMIERIGDIVWATNSKYDEGKSLNEKVSNFVMQARQLSALKVDLHISEEIAGMKLRMDVRRNVFLVIKEAVNNILKHANASFISVSIHLEQKKLNVRVTDNGIGFDLQNHNDGNGLENIKTRTESIGGKFTLISAPGKGTKISAVIPLN